MTRILIHDNLEFHNVAELNTVDGFDGLRMQRVPETVRQQLNEGTAGVMLSPADCEIRFRLAEGCESATLRLSSESATTLYVYHGPFQGARYELGKDAAEVTIKPHKRIAQLMGLEDSPYEQGPWDPRLVRVCFGGPYPEPVFYHGHDGNVVPPEAGDAPDKTYLAYGTSITHGTGLSGAAISYPAHVAWRLGYQVRNFGASGCCMCEPAIADYLAEQACDVATLALSVNMLGQCSADEFKERAGYLVERVADSDPGRPVVCITIFPHFRDIDAKAFAPECENTAEGFREVLRGIVKGLGRPNLSLIEGPELLPSIEYLTADLIHPGVRGLVQIGEELSRRLERVIG